MIDHKTGTREQWLAARLKLLDAERELVEALGHIADILPKVGDLRLGRRQGRRDRRPKGGASEHQGR